MTKQGKSYWTQDNFPITTIIRNPGGARTFKSGLWRILKPIVDNKLCNQCGRCQIYCPDGVVWETKDQNIAIDYHYCKGCGICANECPTNAIQMVVEGVEILD